MDLAALAQSYEQAKSDQTTAAAALADADSRFGPAKDALIAGFVQEFGPGPFGGSVGGTTPPAGAPARHTARPSIPR